MLLPVAHSSLKFKALNIEECEEEEGGRGGETEESLSLALGQTWVWSVSTLIFLASANEGRWPVFSLVAYLPTNSVLIIAEGGAKISIQISAMVGNWTPNLSIGSPGH